MGSLTPGNQLTPSLRLVRPLGEGGMGTVWIAEHTGLRTQVVVKFMSEALAANPEAVARFSREAAAASAVKSPHVVHMIDYGVLESGAAFIAMELLEGHDLRHRLETERILRPRQVATLVHQVAKALGRAHERGVVHRDIKPENIFLSDGGGEAFVKVLDFGLAKVDDAQKMSHTRTGASVGTPYYMSPEQMLGSKTIDRRTDLWSLGVVALEAMTGQHPFDGETVGALTVAICSQPLPVPSKLDSSLPPALDAWFARACGREVAERYDSAKELADAFEGIVGGREAIPFAATASTGLAHAHTEVESAPLAQSPAMMKSPVASSTLGALSDSLPRGGPPRRRWQSVLALGSVLVVLAIGGRVLFRSAPRPLASSAPTEGPTAAAQPPVIVTPPPLPSSQTPVAASATPSAPPSSVVKAAPLVSPAPKLVARPSASGTKPAADPFGDGRR